LHQRSPATDWLATAEGDDYEAAKGLHGVMPCFVPRVARRRAHKQRALGAAQLCVASTKIKLEACCRLAPLFDLTPALS